MINRESAVQLTWFTTTGQLDTRKTKAKRGRTESGNQTTPHRLSRIISYILSVLAGYLRLYRALLALFPCWYVMYRYMYMMQERHG